MRARLWGAIISVVVGCGVVPGVGIDAADVPVPPFPECVADRYAYFGETTMAALGVSRPSGRPPPDANRVGTIWITADRRFNEGEPLGMAEGRMLCVEFPDGGANAISAMTNFPVVDSWQPPGAALDGRLAGGFPWQLVLAGLGAVVLLGASFLAFRQRR
ncbi:MAG: hypothetical protein ACRD1H_09725 [Vicinamibacterales bacterium]